MLTTRTRGLAAAVVITVCAAPRAARAQQGAGSESPPGVIASQAQPGAQPGAQTAPESAARTAPPSAAQTAPQATAQPAAQSAAWPTPQPAAPRIAPPIAQAPLQPAAPAPLFPPGRSRTLVLWLPLSLTSAVVDLEVEHAFHPMISGFAGIGPRLGMSRQLDGSSTPFLAGLSASLGFRLFPLGTGPSGFFIAFYGGVHTTEEIHSSTYRGFGGRAGLGVGYTFVAWNHVALSLSAAVQYVRFTSSYNQSYEFPQIVPLRLAIGPAF